MFEEASLGGKTVHQENKESNTQEECEQRGRRGRRGQAAPVAHRLLFPPPAVHPVQICSLMHLLFLRLAYNLGMIPLEMWSDFRKVGLRKGLVWVLDMGLASFGK